MQNLEILLSEPAVLTSPAPWAGHIPFAFWLMANLRPTVFVELGAYSGISYFAFCKCVAEQNLSTQCYAVDTWQGDEHAGIYGESVFKRFLADNQRYAIFSQPVRCHFDAALNRFEDGSIALLHIDGLHTYEAVRHDFETWRPKLAQNSVVLFHDISVKHSNFGVFRYWAELKNSFPTIEFEHSNGLGVLFLGVVPGFVAHLLENKSEDARALNRFFPALGERFELRAEKMHLRTALDDAQSLILSLDKAGVQRDAWIEKLDADVLEKDRQLEALRLDCANADERLQTSELQCAVLRNSATVAQLAMATLKQAHGDELQRLKLSCDEKMQLTQESQIHSKELDTLRAKIRELHAELDGTYASKSWKLTAPLRILNEWLRSFLNGAILAKARTGSRMLAQGRFLDFLNRLKHLLAQQPVLLNASEFVQSGEISLVAVMYTPHTLFVAKGIENALRDAGLTVDLLDKGYLGGDRYKLYFVICPQMHQKLPPPEKRICFQMEQSVSDRWFTAEYLSILEKSLAVADYSQSNLAYLSDRGVAYPHTFYVPVGTYFEYENAVALKNEATIDRGPTHQVFFYGDVSSPRRQAALAVLSKSFSVRVEKDLFGQPLYEAMRSCAVVVNVHFYENALLETTRVCECLSLDMPVVSESSVDISEHAVISSLIEVYPLNDLEAMVACVRRALDRVSTACERVGGSHSALENHFRFSLYRMLLALNVISFSDFSKHSPPPQISDACVLSLPETTSRRKAFLRASPENVQVFDGIRLRPGWMGCALSYKYLAQQALAVKQDQLKVMEDDVRFGNNFPRLNMSVDRFLRDKADNWDVFSGLMAKIHPDTKILDVHVCPDTNLMFVTVDRMMSMVYNVYRPKALQLLANWDEDNTDPHSNTIDHHLQQFPLRVVTTVPFLVGHDESLNSSLWGISNAAYADLIADAEATLQSMAEKFLAHSTV